MGTSSLCFNLVLLLGTLISATSAYNSDNDNLVEELEGMRDRSASKVIRMKERDYFKYALENKRDYNLFVFFLANQLINEEGLKLPTLVKEFSLAAQAFAKGPDSSKAFFVEIIYEESPSIFQRYGANQMPFVFRVAPGKKSDTSAAITLPPGNKITQENAGSSYPWSAETFVQFFEKRSGLTAAPVPRPKLIEDPTFQLLLASGVVLFSIAGYILYRCRVLYHPAIYLIGAIVVFWFATSGGMYNIIRGMPFVSRGKDGNMIWFIASKNSQLGAEGFVMGTAYLTFSTCIALVTYIVPHMSNKTVRQSLTLLLTGVMGYVVFKASLFYAFKSGYSIVSYL